MEISEGVLVRCTECGTTFSTSDFGQMQQHAGHWLEHVRTR